ncbi:DUF421 domain-containing protein [Spirosoma sp. KUDC1026]|uniref:DUF421 domain-containing protein n=1 Tax=Spirosoma sp. KUDC1026 TaxID=2745947 RepID=UPI00159B9FB6|nr:YetF domain-containing protein [Spirosoma sp. KUDC1026]QKZ13022.1 DUF421 domain-containing protein [Spirosoma sp. KUDC1026]
MKPENIHWNDWVRILIGEVPGSYFIEIVFRMAFIYLLLTISMRLMGKRMASQLNRNELAAQVSLAATIGMPILAPDRGLLPAAVIAIVIVIMARLVSRLSYEDQSFEALTQDDISSMVSDGVMQMKNMRGARVSRERLLEQLRSGGLMHLGQVKRLYIEASGSFTMIKADEPRPGLSIIPLWDSDFEWEQKHLPDQYVCNNCGNPGNHGAKPDQPCDNCKDNNWVKAVE